MYNLFGNTMLASSHIPTKAAISRAMLNNTHTNTRPKENQAVIIGDGIDNSDNDILVTIEFAKQKTGFTDLGFAGGAKIIETKTLARRLGLERSGMAFTSLGHCLAVDSLATTVSHRLRLMNYLTLYPGIKEVRMKPPVFLTGNNMFYVDIYVAVSLILLLLSCLQLKDSSTTECSLCASCCTSTPSSSPSSCGSRSPLCPSHASGLPRPSLSTGGCGTSTTSRASALRSTTTWRTAQSLWRWSCRAPRWRVPWRSSRRRNNCCCPHRLVVLLLVLVMVAMRMPSTRATCRC